MLVHSSLLKKLSRFGSGTEIRLGQEMIILAFDFARPRRPRRAGDGVDKIRRLSQCIAERRFARARWCGDDKQNSSARELITQGFGFVREFFPIPICRRRRAGKLQHRLI